MTIYCYMCGKALPDDSSFCQHCGTPVAKNAAPNPSGGNAQTNRGDTAAMKPAVVQRAGAQATGGATASGGLSSNAKIGIGVAAGVVGLALIAFIALFAMGLGPFHHGDALAPNEPAQLGDVKCRYELQDVKDGGATTTLLLLEIDNAGAVRLTNGDVTISGKLVRASQSNGSTIYKVDDLRGGGSKVITKDDTLALMVPDGAEQGDISGTWRMTIGADGGKSYETVWATVNQDGTALLGSSDDDGFASGWSANVGESIVQTWAKDADGEFTFTDKSGNKLKARLTA